MAMRYRRENHSVSDLRAHLIFVTKYRQKVLSADGLAVIEAACRDVSLKMGFQILEFNGEDDHVHLLVEYPPKLSISRMVNALKGVSSRRYGQAGLPKPKGKVSLWAPAHFSVSVGGAPLEILKQYIQQQEKPP
ncbi:MAG: IS200/IS605 family transposase [Thermostichus sp. DG_1_6_bins_120]